MRVLTGVDAAGRRHHVGLDCTRDILGSQARNAEAHMPLADVASSRHSANGRRIVLIGGAGFIGHHLALRLAARGWDVTVIDDLQINNLGRVSAWPHSPEQIGRAHV